METNMMSPMGFRLVYLNFTLAYSKGQLGIWNDVRPNMLTFLYKVMSISPITMQTVC